MDKKICKFIILVLCGVVLVWFFRPNFSVQLSFLGASLEEDFSMRRVISFNEEEGVTQTIIEILRENMRNTYNRAVYAGIFYVSSFVLFLVGLFFMDKKFSVWAWGIAFAFFATSGFIINTLTPLFLNETRESLGIFGGFVDFVDLSVVFRYAYWQNLVALFTMTILNYYTHKGKTNKDVNN